MELCDNVVNVYKWSRHGNRSLVYVERNRVCYCYSSYREEGTPASFDNSPWCHAHAQVQPE
jgi:hypothetical protein